MSLLSYQIITQALAMNNLPLIQQGRETCLALLRRKPDALAVVSLLAEIEYRLGHWEQAQECLETALAGQPDSVELYYNYGQVLKAQKKYPEALRALRQACRLQPDNAELVYHLGTVYAESGHSANAMEAYAQTVSIAPKHLEALNGMGVLLMEQDELEDAARYFEQVLAIDPAYFYALTNLGSIYHCQSQFDKSMALFRQAIALEPNYPVTLNNLGAAQHSAGMPEAAADTFKKALALDSACPELHANLAMALLAAGRLEEGWQEFEWRSQLFPLFGNREQTDKPRWQNADSGGTLLLRGEQGFGDTLQFCRYAALAAERGLRVVLEVQTELVRLLASSLSGAARVLAYGDPLPEFDYYCPMMSLPLAFHTRLDTIPAPRSYLAADEPESQRWRQRMPTQGRRLNVGLVWAGKRREASMEHIAADRRRSMPFAVLAPLLALDGVQFYSLQKDGAVDPAVVGKMIDWTEECRDFASTAALISQLDLVISVDTAVAHLTGALGQPIWLLNRFDSCWRWLQDREDSPWYPSMRIFRQPRPGDWDSVIQAVSRELRQWTVAAAPSS